MCANFLLINGKILKNMKSSFMFGNSSHSFINGFWSFPWKVKVHNTVAAQTAILGQALAQKVTWLPNINIKFKMIDVMICFGHKMICWGRYQL